MLLLKEVEDVIQFIEKQKQTNKSIGFVPTMGALHKGHFSLLSQSKKENELTVCSIFVNPTQFNNQEDLNKYPKPLKEDLQCLAQSESCDLVFIPSIEEIYPDGTTLKKPFPLGNLENIFEGEHRPGHFQGVVQIVHKLLNIITPDNLYMGQKDYQQCLIIKRLIEIEKLHIRLVTCPIHREEDGLAFSSRNRRLTPSQRILAGLIYQCLVSIQAQKEQKDFSTVKKECLDLLQKKGFQPDYVALADAKNLSPMDNYEANHETIALIAASLGNIRLIDNLIL